MNYFIVFDGFRNVNPIKYLEVDESIFFNNIGRGDLLVHLITKK